MTLTHVGLMVGAPEPMMGFPSGTRFTPYLALRNATEKELSLAATLYLPSGAAVTVPIAPLKPLEARQVDGRNLLAAAGLKSFSGIVTLTLSFTGMPTDLLDAAGSIDGSGSYVLEVDSKTAEPSLSKDIPFWTVGEGQDTMLSVWNPTGAEEDIVLTIYFRATATPYRLPIHLAPFASSMIDLAQTIAQFPDLPPRRVQEGSMSLASPQGPTAPMTLGASVGIFDASTGTCFWGCLDCSGYYQMTVMPGSANLFPTQSTSFEAYGLFSGGGEYAIPANWSSNSPSVATVNNGDVTAQGISGSAGIIATTTLQLAGQICEYNPNCADLPWTQVGASASVTVYPPTYLTVSVGSKITYNGGAVYTPDGQLFKPAPCYGYSRAYTYQIWSSGAGAFTQPNTSATENNTTTSANPKTLGLTPSSTTGTLQGYFYDIQANCTKAAPGPPAGTYAKGTQQISISVGPYRYSNVQTNTIDMEATDVTVTCTANCH